MIAPAGRAIVMETDKPWLVLKADIALLLQFARQRHARRLPGLDPAARQMPARHIGVADQEDAASAALMHDDPHAQRRGTAQQEIEVEQAHPEARSPGTRQDRSPPDQSGPSPVRRNALRKAMFRLAHLSDIHLGPLPEVRYRDLASKRITGYINWHRNRRRHLGEDTLSRVCADIAAHAPDHIALTGDLVNLALDTEIETARLWLEGFGPGRDISVIPGNHDAYVPGALDKACRAWSPWMTGDGANAPAGGKAFPYMRVRGQVAIVGVSRLTPCARKPRFFRVLAALPRSCAVEFEPVCG